jgi:hypothetical protein
MDLQSLVEKRLDRIKDFYSKPRGALVNVGGVETVRGSPARPLNTWKFPAELYPYLDTLIEQAENHWQQREDIDDDLLPSVYPWFGIAEHSAIVGGDIRFAEATSYQVPLITDWGKLDSITLSEENKWFRMLMDGFRYLKEKTRGKLLVRLRGADGPMDMANALRGNDLFTDFYDYPEEAERLIAFCGKAVNWSFEHQRSIAGELEGGFLSGFAVWMPGNSAGHISEDASVLCSPELYRRFGRPYTEELCASYDGMLIHIHSAGRHAIPDIVSIPQFTCVELTNDPNAPRGIEVFREYEKALENRIVMLHLTREEFERNRPFLESKKIIIDYSAASGEDARSMLEAVRGVYGGRRVL